MITSLLIDNIEYKNYILKDSPNILKIQSESAVIILLAVITGSALPMKLVLKVDS
jgi:hypothetical protein